MKVIYEFSKKELIPETHKNYIKFLLDKLKNEGAEEVRVYIDEEQHELKLLRYTGVIVGFYTRENLIYIWWFQEGKWHREDGPAIQICRIDMLSNKIVSDSVAYYYKDILCRFRRDKEQMNNENENSDIILIDKERLSKHVYLTKLLTKTTILDIHYWVQDSSDDTEKKIS